MSAIAEEETFVAVPGSALAAEADRFEDATTARRVSRWSTRCWIWRTG